jgi:hypothetical protein
MGSLHKLVVKLALAILGSELQLPPATLSRERSMAMVTSITIPGTQNSGMTDWDYQKKI